MIISHIWRNIVSKNNESFITICKLLSLISPISFKLYTDKAHVCFMSNISCLSLSDKGLKFYNNSL